MAEGLSPLLSFLFYSFFFFFFFFLFFFLFLLQNLGIKRKAKRAWPNGYWNTVLVRLEISQPAAAHPKKQEIKLKADLREHPDTNPRRVLPHTEVLLMCITRYVK